MGKAIDPACDVPLCPPPCNGPLVTRAEHHRAGEYDPAYRIVCLNCGDGRTGTDEEVAKAERARAAHAAKNGASPILLMAASPTCAPGWHPVPGAKLPPGAPEALALVVRELVPLNDRGLTAGERDGIAACLPPEGYAPTRTDRWGCAETGLDRRSRPEECFFGFWFSSAAINFVRAHHPGVRWAPGGADGFRDVTEVDLLHGWVGSRCVAAVLRMAPTPEGA